MGGWAYGLLAAGFDVEGFDILPEPDPYPAIYHQRDVLTMDASELQGAAVIVASPPCQGFSLANAQRHRGERPNAHDLALVQKTKELIEGARPRFWAVENVRGALRFFEPIFGAPRLRYGAFYLWGDFPSFLVEQTNAPQKFAGSRWWPGEGKPRVPYRPPSETSKIPLQLSRPFAAALAEACA